GWIRKTDAHPCGGLQKPIFAKRAAESLHHERRSAERSSQTSGVQAARGIAHVAGASPRLVRGVAATGGRRTALRYLPSDDTSRNLRGARQPIWGGCLVRGRRGGATAIKTLLRRVERARLSPRAAPLQLARVRSRSRSESAG